MSVLIKSHPVDQSIDSLTGGLMAGVDEAGRGCLAGPVTAAAVILNPQKPVAGLDDSKKLTARRREQLRHEIILSSVAWSIGWGSVHEIDKVNILQATFLAMRRAVNKLDIIPDQILVDGNQNPDFGDIATSCIVGGDALIESIAAASVLAKTARDMLMQRWHCLYPAYGFNSNKGYPSKYHRQAIKEHGKTLIHRRSFSF